MRAVIGPRHARRQGGGGGSKAKEMAASEDGTRLGGFAISAHLAFP
jgi:hypothetical protein